MKRSPVAQRLLALFVAAGLCFDFPLLQLFAASPLALFVLWAVVIAVLAWIVESDGSDDGGAP
jgi:hypothetical protein